MMRDLALVIVGMGIAANWSDWMFPRYVGPALDWLRCHLFETAR